MDAITALEKAKKETERSPICLYPDEILAGYKLIEPRGYVTVRGTVKSLRPYKDICVYGDLEGKSPKTSLSAFLRSDEKNIFDLLVIGTKRGLSDYKTSFFQENDIPWNETTANIIDIDTFINDVQQAIEEHKPKALAILRGGSTTEKGMKIWNDAKVIDFLLKTECKIYSAIGHSDGFVILDKYADQHFSTPSDFGHVITNEIKQILAEEKMTEEYNGISHDNDILKERLSNTELK